MTDYKALDAAILQAISSESSPLYNQSCNWEAQILARSSGRIAMRIIDGRLQKLRKAGVIQFSKDRRWTVLQGVRNVPS